MKLIVKLIDAPGVLGGKAYAIHNEQGEMLPLQTQCDVHCSTSTARVTVEFIVDGKDVVLA